jgi:hypothetical protein
VASGNAQATASAPTTAAQVNGVAVLSTVDSIANREVYVRSTSSPFLFTAGKTLAAEVLLQFAEGNVNQAAVGFGFMDAVGLGALQDNSGEPRAGFSGAVLYKVPGGTRWKTASAAGGTANVNQSDQVAGGSSFQRLAIEVKVVSATVAEVSYYVDAGSSLLPLRNPGALPSQVIKDQLTFTGGQPMQLFFGLKSGSVTPETLQVDYISGEAVR